MIQLFAIHDYWPSTPILQIKAVTNGRCDLSSTVKSSHWPQVPLPVVYSVACFNTNYETTDFFIQKMFIYKLYSTVSFLLPRTGLAHPDLWQYERLSTTAEEDSTELRKHNLVETLI